MENRVLNGKHSLIRKQKKLTRKINWKAEGGDIQAS